MRNPSHVFIFQMGRVGSNSVMRAVNNAEINAIHAHYLYPPVQPNHGNLRGTKQYMAENLLDPVLLISIIRDPIARTVSSWFRTRNRQDLKHYSGEGVAGELIETDEVHWALDWWETQFQRFTHKDPIATMMGISYKDHAVFDFHRGKGVILRTENLSWMGSVVLSGLLGTPIKIMKQNSTLSRTDTAEEYSRLLPEIKFPIDYLETVYDHPIIKTAYTADEISQFKARWRMK